MKCHVRIADFGLSKQVHEISGSTRPGGVNCYMAPELANQKSGHRKIQPEESLPCDCWAFGICIYVVLVGAPLHVELSDILNEVVRQEDWERGRLNLQRADTLSEAPQKWRDFLFNKILNGLIEVDLNRRSTAETVYEDMCSGTFQDGWWGAIY